MFDSWKGPLIQTPIRSTSLKAGNVILFKSLRGILILKLERSIHSKAKEVYTSEIWKDPLFQNLVRSTHLKAGKVHEFKTREVFSFESLIGRLNQKLCMKAGN